MSAAVQTPVQVSANFSSHDKYHDVDELDASPSKSRTEAVIPRNDDSAISSPSGELSPINTSAFRGSSNLYSKSMSKEDSSADHGSDISMDDITEAVDEGDGTYTASEKLRDEEVQRALYDEGAKNYENAKAQNALKLPKDILRQYLTAYPVVRRWWIEGVKSSGAVDMVNKNIERMNLENKRRPELYKFPTTWLISEIENLRVAVSDVDHADPTNRAVRVRKVTLLIKTAMQKLDDLGIPFKTLVSQPVKAKLEQILAESESLDIGSALEPIQNLNGPVLNEKSLLDSLTTELDQFSAAVSKNDSVVARAAHGRLEAFAKELSEMRMLYGLEDYLDYVGPIGELSKLLYTNLHPVPERIRLIEQFRVRYLAPTSAMTFPQATSNSLQPIPTTTNHSADTSAAGHGDTIARPDYDAVRPGKYSHAAFQLPSYQDGFTHLGKIIGIRKAGFGYRVIVDCGTSQKAHFKIFSGSSFGKGIISGHYKDFLLKGPSVSVRAREWTHIKIIRHVVTVESDKSNGSARSYFYVEYKSNADNPYYKDHPLSEWLTMSELTALYGRTLIRDNIAPKCQAKWHANEAFFQGMKLQMLHPDTKQPLSRLDKRNSPWLFPEDDTTTDQEEDGNGVISKEDSPAFEVPVDDNLYA